MPLLSPPRAVLDIARRLEEAGFETWCVGGAIRDALLGHPDLDWDLATAATPDQVRALFRRTIPVGIEFGTVGVLDAGGTLHEVTTFRRDVQTDGRHAVVEFGASLDDDLARRDFTINAIAYSPARDVLHDPFGGREDLTRKLVRAVGDPAERMREDRLRALRAIRFASRFGFAIEPGTWRAIEQSAPLLMRLSSERVRQELEKTMDQVARPAAALRLWKAGGALATLVPALAGIPERNLLALDCLPRLGLARRPHRKLDRLTALFLGLPADEATHALRALRFSNADVAWIAALVERWRELGDEMAHALAATAPPSPAQVRRWVARIGRTRVASFLRLAAAMWAADRSLGVTAPTASRVRALYRAAIRSAFGDALETGDLAVDGADLLDAGIPPGPGVGRILRALLEGVLADPAMNVRDRLLSEARRLAGEQRDE